MDVGGGGGESGKSCEDKGTEESNRKGDCQLESPITIGQKRTRVTKHVQVIDFVPCSASGHLLDILPYA